MRVLLVVVVLAACGDGKNQPAADCTDGEMRECYGGPPGSENVGPCKTGLEICSGGRWPGICIGDVVPRVELCNEFDDNCNGIVDDVATTGDPCTGTNGCEGTRMCDDSGRVRCIAPSKNECEVCGGAEVADLGDDCEANGCVGALVCTADGQGSECAAPTQNECGTCGGPPVTALNTECMSGDGCTGMMVCNIDGTAAVCNAPMKNECMACAPPVPGLGVVCSGSRGCVGMTACNTAGDAAVCVPDEPCGHIVISELSTGSSVCTTDEFIELYNPTSRAIPLAGYTLRYRSVGNTSYTSLVVFSATATIAPHGFFLTASARSSTGCSNSPNPGGGYASIAANTVTADATFTAVNLSSTGASIWLTTADQDPVDENDAIVVDVVSYGSPMFQGQNPAPAVGGAIERKANETSTAASMAAGGTDETAGNAYDVDDAGPANFVEQATRVPQNTSSTPEP